MSAIVNTGGGSSIASVQPQIVSVSLSSAQIQALFTTPITIVAAPGSGNMIQVTSILYSLTYGAATYVVSSGNVGLYYGTAAGRAIDVGASTPLTATSSKLQTESIPAISLTTATSFGGLPVVFASSAVNPTTGDGTFRVTVTYIVSPL